MKYIFEITIKPGYSVEQYAAAWCRASELIQQAPGAKGTFLHRNINDHNKLLAIAHWESKAARDRKGHSSSEEVRSILEKQAKFVDIKVIGEFEDPQWQVIPCQSEA